MFDTTKRIIEFFLLLALAIFITLAAVAWAVPARAEPPGCARLMSEKYAVETDYKRIYDGAVARQDQMLAMAFQTEEGTPRFFHWIAAAKDAGDEANEAILKLREYGAMIKLKTIECETR
jgi:hypothetical protein